MIDHPTAIYLSGGIKREGIDRLVVEHVVRYTRGGYPKRVSLNATTGIDSIPESQGYDSATGIYRTVFKVPVVTDPDAESLFSITGSYTIQGEKYPTPFKHTDWLSTPEQPLVIKFSGYKLHDQELVVSLIVRRANGKIPKNVSFDSVASRSSGLITGQITSQSYNSNIGELTGYYKAKSKAMFGDIDYASEIRYLPEQPGTKVEFEGRLNATRSVTYKVISKAIKGKLLNVAVIVKWADTNEAPASFKLMSPFLSGTNVPTGIVDPSSSRYDPKSGLYEFGVAVNTIPNGHLEYSFNTQALVENYPAIDFRISFGYEHQSTYNTSLLNVSLGDGLLQARWKITSNENRNYELEHLAVPPADLAIGVIGPKAPKVEYHPKDGELVTTWEVTTDPSTLLNYKLTGHFIIDNKYVPWFVNVVAKPMAIHNESIRRESESRVRYELDIVSDGKIKSVDSTTLYVLVNRIPSSIKVVQELNKLTNRVSSYFDLPAPTDEAVEVELLGNLIVESDTIRKMPVHVKMVDYIPSPNVGTELQYETVEHTVVNDVEKLVLRPTFKDGTSPVNLELLGSRVSLNGNEIVVPKVTYRNGLLSMLFKFKPTGLAEEHVVVGKCMLPGYENPVDSSFESVTTFGSNDFPALIRQTNAITIGAQLTGILKITDRLNTPVKDVKIVKFINCVNIAPELCVNFGEHYDEVTGDFSFNTKCKESKDTNINYSFGLVLEITVGSESREQTFLFKHARIPNLNITSTFIGYKVIGGKLVFTHKLESNRQLPLRVTVEPSVSHQESIDSYDPKTGLLVHSCRLDSVEEVVSKNITFDIKAGNRLVNVSIGDVIYGPACKATYYNHELNGNKLTYRWVFRDAMGGIPKHIRIDDFWKHNINVKARTIDLVYDRNTGIGEVVVEALANPGKDTKLFAEAKFQFPSPDVNFYPLEIKL